MDTAWSISPDGSALAWRLRPFYRCDVDVSVILPAPLRASSDSVGVSKVLDFVCIVRPLAIAIAAINMKPNHIMLGDFLP